MGYNLKPHFLIICFIKSNMGAVAVAQPDGVDASSDSLNVADTFYIPVLLQ